MRKSINQVAHKIGMQNQYLAHAVWDGLVEGEVINDWHNKDSWVEIESVKKYVQWRFDNYVISKESLDRAMEFLNSLS